MKPDWAKATRSGDLAHARQILQWTAGHPNVNSDLNQIINSKDRHGQTALMLAAKGGHTSLVEFLIAAGAELNHTAKFNLSALMLAVINNHADVARFLVDAGADTEIRGTGAPGFFQKTALDLAKARESAELVEILDGR